MEKIMHQVDINFLKKKEELLFKINELRKYWNEDGINYLLSLIMLKSSIFNNIDLAEYLGGYDIFRDVANYNICYKTINTIENLNKIDQNKFVAYFTLNSLIIYYFINSSTYFKVFQYDFAKSDNLNLLNKDESSINLYEFTTTVDEQILKINNEINKFFQKNYVNYNQLTSRCDYKNIITRELVADMKKVSKLRSEIKRLEEYGEIQMDISNIIFYVLKKDWDIQFDDNLVRKISWINIYNNRK